jgi:hypothetical protein
MPSDEYYADLERRCQELEARVKSEIGSVAYERVDKKSGFISATEYGLYAECLAENLYEQGYRPSTVCIAMIEELLQIMGLDLRVVKELKLLSKTR